MLYSNAKEMEVPISNSRFPFDGFSTDRAEVKK
jgi:hypothetical protein